MWWILIWEFLQPNWILCVKQMSTFGLHLKTCSLLWLMYIYKTLSSVRRNLRKKSICETFSHRSQVNMIPKYSSLSRKNCPYTFFGFEKFSLNAHFISLQLQRTHEGCEISKFVVTFIVYAYFSYYWLEIVYNTFPVLETLVCLLRNHPLPLPWRASHPRLKGECLEKRFCVKWPCWCHEHEPKVSTKYRSKYEDISSQGHFTTRTFHHKHISSQGHFITI